MKSNSEQLAILRDNIQFGLYQGKETKASLSRKTGITRSTIYKILDGKVERVQAATVEKIAGFFGTTCYIIQNESLESHCTGSLVSIDGNKNPTVQIMNLTQPKRVSVIFDAGEMRLCQIIPERLLLSSSR